MIGRSRKLEMTPVVVDGVMYVTAVNEAYALDARTGREIWHFTAALERPVRRRRRRNQSRRSDPGRSRLHGYRQRAPARAAPVDRQPAVGCGDGRFAPELRRNFRAAGGQRPGHLRHFGRRRRHSRLRRCLQSFHRRARLAFLDRSRAGEPLSETWAGKALEHGCGAAWLTGTYDTETNLLFWATGNPCPDYNGDERKGDNLYSDSVLALEPETGKLRWYFQYTPHDLHDWDSTQTAMLVDAEFQGKPRKLLLHANRNGFFYVLDRTNGKFLRATPFVQKLNWAKGIGSRWTSDPESRRRSHTARSREPAPR